MDWIQNSYSSQATHLRNIRDIGTNHLTAMKDQYYDQVYNVNNFLSYSCGCFKYLSKKLVFIQFVLHLNYPHLLMN